MDNASNPFRSYWEDVLAIWRVWFLIAANRVTQQFEPSVNEPNCCRNRWVPSASNPTP
jgi:hypothetical protein